MSLFWILCHWGKHFPKATNSLTPSASFDAPRYVDVDGDGTLAASDARVINFINDPLTNPATTRSRND